MRQCQLPDASFARLMVMVLLAKGPLVYNPGAPSLDCDKTYFGPVKCLNSTYVGRTVSAGVRIDGHAGVTEKSEAACGSC